MMTSVAVTITTIVPIFSMLIAARLNAKYSKRNISIVGTLIQILGSLIIWIGGSNVAIVFLGVGLMGFGMGFRSNMYFSMLADVADYGEWQSGRNLAGTQMAVNGFSNKVCLHGELMTERWQCSHQKRIWQFYLHLLFFRLLQIS